MHEEVVEFLRCPETGRRLVLADTALVEAVRELTGESKSDPAGERSASQRLEGGLVRDDGEVLYPVVAGIPKLLIDQAIVLEGALREQALALVQAAQRP